MLAGRSLGEDFTIILPTLNEAENIGMMIETLSALYPTAHILVMDDNSPDGTADRAREKASAKSVEVVVREPSDKGLTASVIEGILRTRTKYFVVLDADFQHPPTAIASIMESLNDDKDLTIGVREDKMNLMFFRKMASGGAHTLAKSYLTLKRQPRTVDTMSGFFGGRTDIFQQVIKDNEKRFERKGFKVLFDLLKFAPRNIKIGEVTFTFNARRGGESKLNSKIVISILKQCGVVGKTLAVVSTFFFMTSGGRFMAAVLLGLLSTFTLISLTGGDAWSNTFSIYTLLALIFALVYMVLVSEFIMKWKGESMTRGLSLVSVALSAYGINLVIFYMLAEILPDVQVIASLLGLAIAFGFNTTLGPKTPKPTL